MSEQGKEIFDDTHCLRVDNLKGDLILLFDKNVRRIYAIDPKEPITLSDSSQGTTDLSDGGEDLDLTDNDENFDLTDGPGILERARSHAAGSKPTQY